MKRLVTNFPASEIDVSRCGTSKWYSCRTAEGVIYVLTCGQSSFYVWSRVSSLDKIDSKGMLFDDALEFGMRAGNVFRFDSLAELGLWLTENG